MEKHHRTASCFFLWISTTMTYVRKYDVICSWLYQSYVLTTCTMSHFIITMIIFTVYPMYFVCEFNNISSRNYFLKTFSLLLFSVLLFFECRCFLAVSRFSKNIEDIRIFTKSPLIHFIQRHCFVISPIFKSIFD